MKKREKIVISLVIILYNLNEIFFEINEKLIIESFVKKFFKDDLIKEKQMKKSFIDIFII